MAKAPLEELDLHPHIKSAIEMKQSEWSIATYDNRTGQLRAFDEWREQHGYDLETMGADDIKRFLNHLESEGYAPGTIEGYFESIRVLFNEMCGLLDIRDDHPVEELLEYRRKSDIIPTGTRKRQEEAKIYLDKDEVMELANHVPAPRVRNELLVKLAFQTGCRRSELADIQLDHVDRKNGRIRIRNKKKRNPDNGEAWRTVYYFPERDGVGQLLRLWLDGGHRDSLSKYAARSDYLFISERAPQLPSDRIGRIILRAAEDSGLQKVMYRDQRGHERKKITAHVLRHSHAMHALKSGIDVRTLQKAMGHGSIEQTQEYLEQLDRDVERTFRQRWDRTGD